MIPSCGLGSAEIFIICLSSVGFQACRNLWVSKLIRRVCEYSLKTCSHPVSVSVLILKKDMIDLQLYYSDRVTPVIILKKHFKTQCKI